MRRSRSLTVYAAAVVLLAAAYCFVPIPHDVLVRELDAVADYARSELLGTAALFLLASGVLAYLAFPAMPMLYIAAGYCMDVWVGGSAVLLGSAVGGLAAYRLFRDHVPRGHRLPQPGGSSLNVWVSLVGLRLSPVVPAPLVNVFAALAEVSPLQHLSTTLVGSAPLIVLYVEIGQQGYLTAAGGMPQWWHFSGCVVLFALSTAMSLLGPWRSVLAMARQMAEETVASLKDSVNARWTSAETVKPIGD